ncbi:MAG: 3-hydroxyacyl-CoA dehydrogenase family protein [Paracoccaceae bacterium]
MAETIKTLGIVGAGTMGAGIAINAISKGVTVRLTDTNADMLDTAATRAEKTLSRWVEKERISPKDKDSALARLETATLEQAAASDIVIEAIFEDLTVKQDLMRRLEPHLLPHTVVATNTSALRVADIADAIGDPSRVIGLHYFSPADINPVCELIVTPNTTDRTKKIAQIFLDQTDRITLICGDTPGFIVNRFFIPIYVEAVRMVHEGIASAGQIDAISKDLFAAGAGILTVVNVIGTRTSAKAAENLAQLGARFAPDEYLLSLGKTNAPLPIEEDANTASALVRQVVEDRLLGALFMPVLELTDADLTTFEQIDTGAQHALKYANLPSSLLSSVGENHARALVKARAIGT